MQTSLCVTQVIDIVHPNDLLGGLLIIPRTLVHRVHRVHGVHGVHGVHSSRIIMYGTHDAYQQKLAQALKHVPTQRYHHLFVAKPRYKLPN